MIQRAVGEVILLPKYFSNCLPIKIKILMSVWKSVSQLPGLINYFGN